MRRELAFARIASKNRFQPAHTSLGHEGEIPHPLNTFGGPLPPPPSLLSLISFVSFQSINEVTILTSSQVLDIFRKKSMPSSLHIIRAECSDIYPAIPAVSIPPVSLQCSYVFTGTCCLHRFKRCLLIRCLLRLLLRLRKSQLPGAHS